MHLCQSSNPFYPFIEHWNDFLTQFADFPVGDSQAQSFDELSECVFWANLKEQEAF